MAEPALPSSPPTRTPSAACWERACRCLRARWAELERYLEIRLLGRGLELRPDCTLGAVVGVAGGFSDSMSVVS